VVTFRFILITALITASPAAAESLEGMGRISVVGGYKWTPNWYFESRAAAQGSPLISRTPGIQGSASFGYGVSSWAEVAVDLFGAWETFALEGYQPFSSTIYGALLGVRIAKLDFLVRGLVPYLQAQVGPSVAQIASTSVASSERVLMGISVSGGLTWRFAERFGITLEARYLQARLSVPEISGANVGGLFASIGVTMFFPGSLERKDLSVPGF